MTTYYVGSGGNDGNNGQSWANRKLTLNGAEDIPVASGDVVYVGPGVYRELLTVDVSGSSGSPITYIGDLTGAHTDGVGGIVRITGSDDDTTVTRANAIAASSKNYRTFRGFFIDLTSSYGISVTTGSNWIIEDCVFEHNTTGSIYFNGTGTGNTVRRCDFLAQLGVASNYNIIFTHTSTVDDAGHVIQNCRHLAYINRGVSITRVSGIAITNCVYHGCAYGIRIDVALTEGQTVTAYNCIFVSNSMGVQATVEGELVENYNAFSGNASSRSNVATGANSNTYPPLFNPPILLDGFRIPWYFGELSKWSQLARIAGTGEATDDLFGITRPATSSKKSWGAIQATGAARETTTTYGSSTASLKLPDAGELFLMRVPVTAVTTTFKVMVYREADYAGDNPQLIVRQAGQSDHTHTDAGASGAWNELSVAFTPAASPGWVDIFATSRNTATSGNYDVFFDSVMVS